MSAYGTKRTSTLRRQMSAYEPKWTLLSLELLALRMMRMLRRVRWDRRLLGKRRDRGRQIGAFAAFGIVQIRFRKGRARQPVPTLFPRKVHPNGEDDNGEQA